VPLCRSQEDLASALDEVAATDMTAESARAVVEGGREGEGCLNWSQVVLQMPGRSSAECQVRWLNHVAPGVNNGPWSKEEDKKLLALASRGEATPQAHAAVRSN